MLCKFCESKIFGEHFELQKRDEGGVPHYYILKWDKDSDLACRSMIYFLKNKPRVFFERLAHHFKSLNVQIYKGPAVVPPSSNPSKINHAKSLAEAYMKQKTVSGVLTVGLVKEGGVIQQKRKSKIQRLRSNKMNVGAFKHAKNWIFVDDVFVSGGTFKSVSESMFTKPQAIFTLIYKPRLKNKGFYDA